MEYREVEKYETLERLPIDSARSSDRTLICHGVIEYTFMLKVQQARVKMDEFLICFSAILLM